MTYINEHYLKLTAGYLFPEIGRRVQAFGQRLAHRASGVLAPCPGRNRNSCVPMRHAHARNRLRVL
jgi:hypothetical protein